MNEFNFQKAINKYAILLSLKFLFNLVWVYFAHNFLGELFNNSQYSIVDFISYAYRFISAIFNIVLAVLVYKDFKRNNIKSPLIIAVTVFFGFIGIVLFFVQLIYTQYIQQGRKLS